MPETPFSIALLIRTRSNAKLSYLHTDILIIVDLTKHQFTYTFTHTQTPTVTVRLSLAAEPTIMADNNAADAVAADAPAADQDEMIVQFSDVTGVRADRARFYLESANWTLQVYRKRKMHCNTTV